MQDHSLGIIGGKGRMGQWFSHYFKTSFKMISIYDLNHPQPLASFCRAHDVLLISVPITQTIPVIEKIRPLVHPGQLVIDFCSLKEAVCRALAKLPCATIGMHPLFGPHLSKGDEATLILCPVQVHGWLQKVNALFRSQKIKVHKLSPKRHDQIMARVQALNHLVQLSYGETLSLFSKREIDQCSTPRFLSFTSSLKQLASQDPSLYREIAFENPYFIKALKQYQKGVQKLLEVVEHKKERAFNALFARQQKYWGEK